MVVDDSSLAPLQRLRRQHPEGARLCHEGKAQRRGQANADLTLLKRRGSSSGGSSSRRGGVGVSASVHSRDGSLDGVDLLGDDVGLCLHGSHLLALRVALSSQTVLVGRQARQDVLHLDQFLLLRQLGDTLVGHLDPTVLLSELALDLVQLADAVVQVGGHLLNVGLSLLHDGDLQLDQLRDVGGSLTHALHLHDRLRTHSAVRGTRDGLHGVGVRVGVVEDTDVGVGHHSFLCGDHDQQTQSKNKQVLHGEVAYGRTRQL
mmetsp:Transcript_15956/g.34650  ORF Transcript_15956/g.34650 Transcript_15956/m.34650 type:complete len:261 (-) Transcript_15956:17-799(-)